uniref:Uncharacterized protein n=1 Tax=Anas platyrhynchos TaxID=8839 RepID=A0A8B9SVH1_ANAPL
MCGKGAEEQHRLPQDGAAQCPGRALGIGQVGAVVCLPSTVCSTADGHEHEAAVKQVRSAKSNRRAGKIPIQALLSETDGEMRKETKWASGPRIHVLDCVL